MKNQVKLKRSRSKCAREPKMLTINETKQIQEIRRILKLLPPGECTPFMIRDIQTWIEERKKTRPDYSRLHAIGRQVIEGLIFDRDDDWFEALRRLKAIRSTGALLQTGR